MDVKHFILLKETAHLMHGKELQRVNGCDYYSSTVDANV